MSRSLRSSYDVVVVGGGVAGLTAAAALARRGAETLLVERHAVLGGSASFYQRDGYRFDVGATLVSGFGPRGAHRRILGELGIALDAEPSDPAMIVHLPDASVVRYGDERWEAERRRVFGPAAEPFWRAQERIADLAWDFAIGLPALPQDVPSALATLRAFRPRHLELLGTLGRTVATLFPADASVRLRAFVDAQLLIGAQVGADEADLAYGAVALDLAREGTYHLRGGVGTLATALGRAVRRSGGEIAYGRSVRLFDEHRGAACGVVLDDGARIACDAVVAALPLAAVAAASPSLAATDRGAAYRARIASGAQRWGAFTVYCGLPPGVVPDDAVLHHQIAGPYGTPLGEGATAFVSFSPAQDAARARNGGRAVTISTHTDVARWERAYARGNDAALKAEYRTRLLAALDRVLPGAAASATLVECGTPATFERYTGRPRGLVGGTPQTPRTANLRAFGHRTPVRGLYVCGDGTFPGQSTVGAMLGGWNAARAVR